MEEMFLDILFCVCVSVINGDLFARLVKSWPSSSSGILYSTSMKIFNKFKISVTAAEIK